MKIGGENTSGITTAISKSTKMLNTASERLASGSRINRAADDAAGLAIANQLAAESTLYSRAGMNIYDGQSQNQIAESAIGRMGEIETRKQELAMQSRNGVYSDEDRAALNQEYQSLTEEQDRMIASTEFNGQKLFNSGSTTLQVGTGSDQNSQIQTPSIDTTNIVSRGDISSADAAATALDSARNGIEAASAALGKLSAVDSRLQSAADGASVSAVTAKSAESRIRDADIAMESANYTKSNILQNVGVALQAQANQSASMVLNLLK